MKDLKIPHAMHDDHLCYLINMGYLDSNFKDYAELIKNPKFVCKRCGRGSDSKENICQPKKI
jgi:hypothetical protein